MSTIIRTEHPASCLMKVWHGEDWYDAIPQMVDPSTGAPWNLSGVTLELFIRPSFNHATRFVLLTSVGSAGIDIEDAAFGLAAIHYSQANVEANLPLTTQPADSHIGWEHFLRASFTDPDAGSVKLHIWTGRCFVLPARDDP